MEAEEEPRVNGEPLAGAALSSVGGNGARQ
jgi:hypothetical protein